MSSWSAESLKRERTWSDFLTPVAVRGSGISVDDDNDGVDADIDGKAASKRTDRRVAKRDQEDAEMRERLPDIAAELVLVHESIGDMFESFVCSSYDKELEQTRRPYLELLEQVCVLYPAFVHR